LHYPSDIKTIHHPTKPLFSLFSLLFINMASAFESFKVVHQYQLGSIPEELWQPLFMKLGEDYLDAGKKNLSKVILLT